MCGPTAFVWLAKAAAAADALGSLQCHAGYEEETIGATIGERGTPPHTSTSQFGSRVRCSAGTAAAHQPVSRVSRPTHPGLWFRVQTAANTARGLHPGCSSPVYSSIPHCHFFLHAHARTPPELGLLRHGSLMAS